MFFTLAVSVSVEPTSIGTSFPFDNFKYLNEFHSNFAYAFVPTMSHLGLLKGKFR